jgi:uncharacterized protein YkvS
MAKVEGTTIKVGDVVGFKSDIEQTGVIIKITGNTLLLKASSVEGFSGAYIGGCETTMQDASRCWID